MKKFLLVSLSFFSYSAIAQVREAITYTDTIKTKEYIKETLLSISEKSFLYIEHRKFNKLKKISMDSMVSGTIDDVEKDSSEYYRGTKETLMIRLKSSNGKDFQYSESTKLNDKYIKANLYNINNFTFEVPKAYLQTLLKIFW
ncbi:hypothetical protein [Spirosoma pollinicola]|uniref:DUF4468 domain-containing protein n=1 Tax=Spirosoma pollinicola TaxID=2057025 RepID=A0A2K8Z9G2_9BACT|nr:hypothetical protein [Spirosoma pollinicola]AUD06490.1 hypothetical protein CWM47_34385 [Spirosoma pollinicola]